MSGLIYHTDKRRVIPQIERTTSYVDTLNVTNPVSKEKKDGVMIPILKLKDEDLSGKIEEWKKSKNYDLAGDIISQALILNKTEEVSIIKEYLLKNFPKDEIFSWLLDNKSTNVPYDEKINHNHKKLKLEPNDSLTWVDQSINFLETNNREEAIKCIERALKINSDLGYIVRNASRIFNLTGDNGRAIKTLKGSEYYNFDPQILSAEISFSQIENRKTNGIEIGHKLLKDNHYKNNEKSELASSLGTVEYFKGEYKKSEQLFDISLLAPNTNSLAQSLWYKKNPDLITKHLEINESNEIKTHRFSNEMDYEKALEHALYWKKEEPYSVRPYRLASHLSGEILGNPNEAFNIIKEASETQRDIKGDNYTLEDEVIFKNDMAYYLLKSGRVDEAEKYLTHFNEIINKSNKLEAYEYVYLATSGLLAYKRNENELGKQLYKKTIKFFTEIKDFYNVCSAFLNYFDEELNFITDLESLTKLKRELDDIITDNSYKDLQFRKKNSLKLFDKKISLLK